MSKPDSPTDPIVILAGAVEVCLLDLARAVGQFAAGRPEFQPTAVREPMPSSSRIQLLTTTEAAKLIGTTAANLRVWRSRGIVGPPWVQIGEATVRYRVADIEAWIDHNTVTPLNWSLGNR